MVARDAAAARRLPKIRVLLVEDDEHHALLVSRLLGQYRHAEVTTEAVHTLAGAVGRLGEVAFDAVVLDLTLPDSAAGPTLESVQRVAPDAAVVVLTSVDDDDLALGMVQRGAQDYIIKSEITAELIGRSVRYAVERKATEVALRHTAERLRRTNEELTRFAHTVAHEVKTPLGVIATGLGLATSGGDGNGDSGSLLTAAENAARDLARYVDELLRFAVDDDSAGSDVLETASIVAETLDVLRPVLEEAEISIDVGPLPDVVGPVAAVRHLFVNLIANAVKHGEADGLRVAISGRPIGGDRIEFVVEDSGRGVEEADRERIFHMFDRGRKRRSRKPGNGIGLAFCRRAVERLGGTIGVDKSSRLGGAAFRFDLPAADRDASAAQPA